MKSLVNRVKIYVHTAASYRQTWWCLIFAVGTIAVVWLYPGPTDLRLRLWALWLQLYGGVVVLLDMNARALDSGHEGILKSILSRVRSILFGRIRAGGPEGIEVSASLVGGRLRTRPAPNPKALQEQRMRFVEGAIQRIDDDIDAVHCEIDALSSSLSGATAGEAAMRRADIERLQQSSLKNFIPMVVGAFWVLTGTVLSALSQEITSIVAGRWAAVWHSL